MQAQCFANLARDAEVLRLDALLKRIVSGELTLPQKAHGLSLTTAKVDFGAIDQHLPRTRRRSARHGSQPQRPKPWQIVREVSRQGLQGRASRHPTWPLAMARAAQRVSGPS